MRGSRRWIMGAIAAGVLCGSSRQGYAGEFGGFDIDIGTEEEIFDNWEEEPERKEEPEIKEKPERDEEPEVITVKPEMDENEQKRSRCTALGTVLTAVGMAKISPDLKYYNNNDKNIEKTKNNNDYNNNTIYFEHENSIPEGECPKIKIINTKEEQDVTILSVRMNQEEISWYLEGDTLVLEQPVTEKTSVIELIAVTDGKMLVSMPAWEFCYLDDIKK